MNRGKFIAFEGGEGAGKSTQARLLANALSASGIDVVLTREPGGTPGAEAIRSLLLHPPGEGWGAEAEALLFAAARADHVAKLIRPALEAGKWVICDRYIDSSRAYQGGAGGLEDADILALHGIGSGGLLPDLTILIQVSAETSLRRVSRRDEMQDAIGGRDSEYHAKVGQSFADFAAGEANRFAKIDGQGAKEETHAKILALISPFLERS